LFSDTQLEMRSQTDADEDAGNLEVSNTTFWAGVGNGEALDMMWEGTDAAGDESAAM
jgi:hypothetical protein